MSLDVKTDEVLWVQRYRPQKVADTILPEKIKKIFQKFVDEKNIPNLLLSGSPGTGKTTVAKAMLEEIGADYIVINGSLNGGIDTLRTEIQKFASSVSFTGGRKFVIIDEADYLNCLEENESVLLSDGNTISLKDMIDGNEYDVLSFNTKTLSFEEDKAYVTNRLEKETFDVELDNGVIINVTEDHPFIVQSLYDGSISQRSIKEGLDGFEIVLK